MSAAEHAAWSIREACRPSSASATAHAKRRLEQQAIAINALYQFDFVSCSRQCVDG